MEPQLSAHIPLRGLRVPSCKSPRSAIPPNCSTATAPPCATEPGVGPIAAATLVCEVGDPAASTASPEFARWCGTGAVALSSGESTANPVKHRLDFRGNRRVNSVLHIASVSQQRSRPDAAAYLARKATKCKTGREARRAHKRHLANRVIHRMWRDEQTREQPLAPAV
ncbi:transposase [Candidatus Poriferisocius sp.]|uniref:transposase n=1 Tax=Candidatus Poriferisocius sp. TaxID=3101276 RepID=UPI003B01FF48